MTHVKDAIRQYLLATHLQGEAEENLADDLPLRTSGILDSFAVMGLVSFIHERFGVELDVFDTGVERFDRVDQMVAAVARKQTLSAEAT